MKSHPKHSATIQKIVATRKQALLVTRSIQQISPQAIDSSLSPLIPSQSLDSCAKVVEKPRAIAKRSVLVTSKNLPGIKSASGTTEKGDSSRKNSNQTTTTPLFTATSLIESSKKQQRKLSLSAKSERELEQQREKNENWWMSFRRGNQAQRRKESPRQTGIPIPPVYTNPLLYAPPALPRTTESYLSKCISRSGRHDCSIHCSYQTLRVYSRTTFFYILDRTDNPVEFWSSKHYLETGDRTYSLEWRQLGYKTLSNSEPIPPRGGRYCYDPLPGVGYAN